MAKILQTWAQVAAAINGDIPLQSSDPDMPDPALTALAVDPADPQRLYAGFFRGGVMVSEDGGASWQPSAGGMSPETTVRDIEDTVLIYRADFNQLIEQKGWEAEDEAGVLYRARVLILTPPVPEGLALLDARHVPLSPEDRAALERIQYAPCLAGLFRVEGGIALPTPGAVQRPAHTFPWIADNRHKGISPRATTITVHADAPFSQRHFDDGEPEIVELMMAALEPYVTPDTRIVEAQIMRWRYSAPLVIHAQRCLVAADLPALVFAGDAFGGPRLEGAYLSGLAAARALSDPRSP